MMDEILEYIKAQNFPTNKLKHLLQKHRSDLYLKLIEQTKFLPTDISIQARLYCIEHEMTDHPICQRNGCSNKVGWDGKHREFRHHCCTRCSTLDSSVQSKYKNTMLENHGVERPLQSKDIKEKTKQTCIERYGVSNPMLSKSIQDKLKQTNLTKFGVDCPLKSNIVRNKIQSTMLERYDVKNYVETSEFKEQSRISMLKHLGVEHALQSDECWQKYRLTSMTNWGVEFPSQSIQFQDALKETLLQKYGVDCTLNIPSVSDKVKQTLNSRYGVEHPLQSPELLSKMMSTTISRHNGIGFGSSEILERFKSTMLDRYGVEHYSKTYEFHKKSHKPYVNSKYPDMTFGSSWEFKVYDYLVEHHIEFEYQPSISLEYEYDGKSHTYHPDFLVNGRLFEVKGDHFFNESGQMVNPFDRTQDGKYEAKHQCMLRNGVTILRESDVHDIGKQLPSNTNVPFEQTLQ